MVDAVDAEDLAATFTRPGNDVPVACKMWSMASALDALLSQLLSDVTLLSENQHNVPIPRTTYRPTPERKELSRCFVKSR